MLKLLKKLLFILVILIIISYILFGVFKVQDRILKNIYPIKYEEYVLKYSEQYSVDKNLIYAIIKAESNFNENAVSNKGATGLMQLMPTTAIQLGRTINVDCNEEKLKDVDININLGVKYISNLIEKYNNIEVALSAYNAGTGNVDNWIEKGIIKKDGSDVENIPYKETNNYVRKILRDYKIYKQLYN